MSACAIEPVQARGNTRGNNLLEPGGVPLSAESAPVFVFLFIYFIYLCEVYVAPQSWPAAQQQSEHIRLF